MIEKNAAQTKIEIIDNFFCISKLQTHAEQPMQRELQQHRAHYVVLVLKPCFWILSIHKELVA